MRRDKKVKIVEEIKEKLDKAKSLVLTDYRGLTHRQLEEMRRAFKKVGAEFVVIKNTLLKKATADGRWQMADGNLAGPTSALFAYEDEIAPFSVLAKFIKSFGLPQIKAGVLAEKILTKEEVLKLASLPSREVLLVTLVSRLKSPLYGLSYSLNYNLQKLVFILKGVKINESN